MRTPIQSRRTRVRRWEDRDRPNFHRLNADEEIMRFFPMRRSRAESDALMDVLNRRLDAEGCSFLALEIDDGAPAVGIMGLARLDPVMPFAPGIEIGWRLLPEYWGQGLANEAAAACVDRVFADPGALTEIVSFCVAGNDRSEAVMRRLGFTRCADFDHPKVDPGTHPDLVRHRCYALARTDWHARA
ncbi:GNAT family N-acetyltransferase [Jiella marina]|uniref:GNAT family N-acetyltransferase n=1 Tax=Jiella sp. LLJ827 TaxID=2917712 RepID=UPI0021009F96|nr:GNAT family N-acetyltransferase [Jiella sp. LLJ827]MCQ0986357.1 GNAT family N-acetyltransferase [Jiella sp. LLJ827]